MSFSYFKRKYLNVLPRDRQGCSYLLKIWWGVRIWYKKLPYWRWRWGWNWDNWGWNWDELGKNCRKGKEKTTSKDKKDAPQKKETKTINTEDKNKKEAVKKKKKEEAKEKRKKMTEAIKTIRQTWRWDLIAEWYKIYKVRTLNLNEIKALIFFESYFNPNSRSEWNAKWLFQLTIPAIKQVIKSAQEKVSKLKWKDKKRKTEAHKVDAMNVTKWIEYWLKYIKWIEDDYLDNDVRNNWRKTISEILKDKKHFKIIVSKYLKKKNIELEDSKYENLLLNLKNNPEYLEKFLVLRKYNADTKIRYKSWEKHKHMDYYALVVMYISEFCKEDVKKREIEAKSQTSKKKG